MTPEEDATKTIAEDFDEKACEFCDRYKESGLSASSKILLTFLIENGMTGKTLLDLGCGAGAFAVETLNVGAASAVGIDLSRAMIKTATELANSRGLSVSAKFEVGNAASAQLPHSEVVVMDKVICCYPELEQLLTNASTACRDSMAFVVPRNEGLVKFPLRLGVGVMNLFEKRRKGSPFYLHSIEKIDEVLKGHGFERQRKTPSRIWLVFLYRRIK